MSAGVCAAPGCDNPVVRRPDRRGRPPIYCSPGCRPSRRRSVLGVEAEPSEASDVPGRHWEVRLRRGSRAVVVQRGLGRFSATALAADIQTLLTGKATS
ncbi:MAG: hypothetical protein M0T79_01300 [Actinomycetota bacterium]|nr:hypothetical protein [Actinomycetota bacterium]